MLCKEITQGGLNMISIKCQQKMFLLKWLNKILDKKNEDSVIRGTSEFFFARVGGVKYFAETAGNDMCLKPNSLESVYWSNVAQVWTEF